MFVDKIWRKRYLIFWHCGSKARFCTQSYLLNCGPFAGGLAWYIIFWALTDDWSTFLWSYVNVLRSDYQQFIANIMERTWNLNIYPATASASRRVAYARSENGNRRLKRLRENGIDLAYKEELLSKPCSPFFLSFSLLFRGQNPSSS